MKAYTNPKVTVPEILSALVFFTIFSTLIYYLSRRYKNETLKKYFFAGALAKLLGGQLLCLIYIYIYKYGDTFRFFKFGLMYRDVLLYSEDYSFWDALFMNNDTFKNITSYVIDYSYAYVDSVFLINKISGIISIFTFDSFLATTMFFSMFSFSGIWKLYQTFVKIYPALYKDFAVAILFYPSVVFWGSGLLKDSLCIGAVGWLTWSLYNIFFTKSVSVFNITKYIIIGFISFWLVKEIKLYIIAAFASGASLWIIFSRIEKIKNTIIKSLIIPVTIVASVAMLAFGLQSFSEELGIYSVETVIQTALDLSYNLSKLDAGSTYDLGIIEPSLFGILKKFPAALNVSLFRPYIWEVRNPIMVLAAFESMIIAVSVILIIKQTGLLKFTINIFSNSILFFCFTYSIIFLFATGISSSNFGTLVRYKIPALPFFAVALFIQHYLANNKPFIKNKTLSGLPKERS